MSPIDRDAITFVPFPTSPVDGPAILARDHDDWLRVAETLVTLILETDQDAMIAARVPVAWEVGTALRDNASDPVRTLGLAFQLQAILQQPDALTAAVRHLQAYLALVAPKVLP